MLRSSIVLTSALAAPMLAAGDDLPVLQGDYCADVVETIQIDGSPPQVGNTYHLCVDNTNVRWNQKGDSYLSIFNGTDIFDLTKNPSAPGGWDCLTKTSGPESRTFMPYRMTTLDFGSELNQTLTYDSIKNVSDYEHFRQGNPPNIPDEYMHWLAAPLASDETAPQMVASDCTQRSGVDRKGPWQHGVRDFTKNYQFEFSQPDLPAGIKCTQKPSEGVEHNNWRVTNAHRFGPASIYGV